MSTEKHVKTRHRPLCSFPLMGSLQERIWDVMNETGLKEADLVRRTGLNQQTVNSFLHGHSDKTKHILDFARALGVRPEWLQWGELPKRSSDSVPPDHQRGDLPPLYTGDLAPGVVPVGREEYASIPRYDARLSAGPGSLMEDAPQPLGYHLIEAQWLRSITKAAPQQLVIVQVDGDSMEPTLSDGDWVLVDTTQRRLNRQGVFALRIQDAAWVKRISLNLRDKLIQIISDNPLYPVQEVEETDVEPLGRVLCIVARRL